MTSITMSVYVLCFQRHYGLEIPLLGMKFSFCATKRVANACANTALEHTCLLMS
jgi:hypothetical protein